MAATIFGNDHISIQAWKRQDGTIPDLYEDAATPPSTRLSFWLRNDPSLNGEIMLRSPANGGKGMEIPPWPRALYCHVLTQPRTYRATSASAGDPTWSTKVGTTLLYEDDTVNVWYFRVSPHANCHYHVHHHPYVFMNLVPGTTQPVDVHGTLLENESVRVHAPGEITFVDVASLDALPHHAFRNVSDAPFCQYIVEFKQSSRGLS